MLRTGRLSQASLDNTRAYCVTFCQPYNKPGGSSGRVFGSGHPRSAVGTFKHFPFDGGVPCPLRSGDYISHKVISGMRGPRSNHCLFQHPLTYLSALRPSLAFLKLGSISKAF
jgi:hypothetical protein